MQMLLSGYAGHFNFCGVAGLGCFSRGCYHAILPGEEDCTSEVDRCVHLKLGRSGSLDLGKRCRRRFGGESMTLRVRIVFDAGWGDV